MHFAINSPWEGYDLSFLRLTTLLHVGNPRQASAAVSTGLPWSIVVLATFQSTRQRTNMSHGPQSSLDKEDEEVGIAGQHSIQVSKEPRRK